MFFSTISKSRHVLPFLYFLSFHSSGTETRGQSCPFLFIHFFFLFRNRNKKNSKAIWAQSDRQKFLIQGEQCLWQDVNGKRTVFPNQPSTDNIILVIDRRFTHLPFLSQPSITGHTPKSVRATSSVLYFKIKQDAMLVGGRSARSWRGHLMWLKCIVWND